MPLCLFDLPKEEVALVTQKRRVDFLKKIHRPCSGGPSLRQVARSNRDLSEQKVAQHSLVLEERFVEELSCARRETPGLKVAAFLEEHNGLVQINQPGPDLVLLLNKSRLGLSEKIYSPPRLSNLAGCDRLIRQRLCSLVADLQLFKKQIPFFRHFLSLSAKVELHVDIRQVEITESDQVGVTDLFSGQASVFEHFNGPAIVAAHVIQIGDVVVGDQMD